MAPDEEWQPDPDRTADSYTDAELRFLPYYRFVKEQSSGLLSDSETLFLCRGMLELALAPEDPEEPEPEVPDHEWYPTKPETEYTDEELRFTPIYRFCQRQGLGDTGLGDTDAVLIACCRNYIRWHEEQKRGPGPTFRIVK